jgi:hypothetical protein
MELTEFYFEIDQREYRYYTKQNGQWHGITEGWIFNRNHERDYIKKYKNDIQHGPFIEFNYGN